jgi:hypothetical protein
MADSSQNLVQTTIPGIFQEMLAKHPIQLGCAKPQKTYAQF